MHWWFWILKLCHLIQEKKLSFVTRLWKLKNFKKQIYHLLSWSFTDIIGEKDQPKMSFSSLWLTSNTTTTIFQRELYFDTSVENMTYGLKGVFHCGLKWTVQFCIHMNWGSVLKLDVAAVFSIFVQDVLWRTRVVRCCLVQQLLNARN